MRRAASNGLSQRPSRSVFATYFDAVDHGIVLIDHTGRIAVCTDEAARLLGLPSGTHRAGPTRRSRIAPR